MSSANINAVPCTPLLSLCIYNKCLNWGLTVSVLLDT